MPEPADAAPGGRLQPLLERRLFVVGGKGGVGRTVVATALARLLTRHGRRVLLAHVRTRQRVGTLLGCDPITDEIREVLPGLFAVNMNPAAALQERGMMILRYKVVYRAVMENRLVRHFLRAIPSLDEYAMLGKAWYHTTEHEEDTGRPRFDAVILDGPATGHLVTMLRIPQVILDVVPEGPLTQDARPMVELLRDPGRTGFWVVTLAEEMPVSEAEDLVARAREDLGIEPAVLVVNALYPGAIHEPRAAEPALERLRGGEADPPELAPALAAERVIHARGEINATYLGRMARTIPLPTVRLPLLFRPRLGPEDLDLLADRIAAELAAPG